MASAMFLVMSCCSDDEHNRQQQQQQRSSSSRGSQPIGAIAGSTVSGGQTDCCDCCDD